MLNIAVFASGKGSNLRAILGAIEAGKIPAAHVVLVLSNNSDSGALMVARENSVAAVHLSRKQFASDSEFNQAMLSTLDEHRVGFIALAGYMKKLDASIIKRYRNRIVNIHPALLPKYGGSGMYGMHVHEAVIAAKERISGASVHIVDEEYDRGPIVLQRSVPVDKDETAESLAAKVLEVEHQLYPEAIRLFAEGRVKVDGQHVTISN
jgi:phosphoribosylglycinamide formyltransferase-1